MGYPVEYQSFSVVIWLIVLFFLQISLIPCMRWLKEPYLVPVSYATSLLLLTLVAWYSTLIGLSILFALIPFLLLFGYGVYSRSISLHSLNVHRDWHILFLVVFLLTLGVKILYNPDIDVSFERFTDHMYLASMMLDPLVPPHDAWYSGGALTGYYYLSQWTYATLGILTSIPSVVVYHLIIPTVFAVTALLIYAISTLFLIRYRYLPLATLAISYPVLFLNIPSMIQQGIPFNALLNGTFRVIPGAITENPLTALFIGSPRAYAIGMINQVLMIFLLCYILKSWKDLGKSEWYGCTALCILCLGSMFPMHSWDTLIYGPILLLCGVILCRDRLLDRGQDCSQSFKWWCREIRTFCPDLLIRFWILIPVGSILLYLPFLFQMDKTGVRGIAWNPFSSDPMAYLLIHGILLLVLYIAIRSDLLRSPDLILVGLIPTLFGFISATLTLIPLLVLIRRRLSSPMDLLAASGLGVLLFCEFFSLIDSNGIDRMNTTYKFYFVAWFLLSIPVWIYIARSLDTWRPLQESVVMRKGVIILLVVGILSFPVTVLILGMPGPTPPTLDGSAWIEHKIWPEEYNALTYLKTLPAGEVIVEGVNKEQTDEDTVAKYYSRVSTFTGIPAVLGSYGREHLYRTPSSLEERLSDVTRIYTKPQEAAGIMKKYGATLLYTGYPEYSLYKITDPGVFAAAGFTPLWNEGATVIWRPPVV
ncbi:MAG TPA: DUF2298 domain-containing protein [Methanospirillum sp.]|nr:DUF2298 domain-containing protein [Methanospirillum sp.]